MMFQQSADAAHKLLIIALLVFAQDVSRGGGAQAWTYNYSTSPSRRWSDASQWCRQNFIDMVSMKNQEETNFLNNLLPYYVRHYWIGVYKRKGDGAWIWNTTGQTVPAEAQNWAANEPDLYEDNDCVEIYIKKNSDTAKWNNENCRRKKGTICYSASCTQGSCSVHADCIETIGNYTCQCHPGFRGSRCEEAIACTPLREPEEGSLNCVDPYGANRFNSSCVFHCDLGFHLEGVPQLQCQASGQWTHPVPLCHINQCQALNHTIIAGHMDCNHPVALYSYNSTCGVRCNKGFELKGQDHIRCDHTGQWTAAVPSCTVKKCPTVLFPVTGNMTCVDTVEPFSFGSQCNFTCQEGYYLTGDSTLTCLASGNWSRPTPTCTVVQCVSLEPPPHATVQCHDPLGVYSYDSTCTIQCEEGFDLIGSKMMKCSSEGQWSHTLPVCQVKQCKPINPPHGSLYCDDPHGSFSFGSQCTVSCDEGFLLTGTASAECDSLGMWSAEISPCLAQRCPTLSAPLHGLLLCSDPHADFSFGSQCNMTCEEGFVPNGTANTECTSAGMWSANLPHCLARRCPTLSRPSHGSLNCSDPYEEFSFGSRCNIACDVGFILNGDTDTECTSVGRWSADIPHCKANRCPPLNSPPHGSLRCSNPHGEFSFGSQCTSTCEEGFVLDGTADTGCTSLGTWSADIPKCSAKRCSALNASAHGSLRCSDPHGAFSFGSRCTSTCEEGFVLNGTADTECTSLGTWSRLIPRCLALSCHLLATAPQHGQMNCSHPHSSFSYSSRCDFECNEGFWLRGASSMTCNTSGHWSQEVPTCQPVQCKALHALPLPLSMNCTHPHGNFSFGSRCNFTCKEGFSLNGTDGLLCSFTGVWSDRLPACTPEGLPLGTALLMYTGVGAGSVVVLLMLIGLGALIVMKLKKKQANMMVSDDKAWEEKENPAFEF